MNNEKENVDYCIREAARFSVGDYVYVFCKNGGCRPYIWYDGEDDMEAPARVVAVVTSIYRGRTASFWRSEEAPEIWVETIVPINGVKKRCNLVWYKMTWSSKYVRQYVDRYDCVPHEQVLDKVAVKEYLLDEKRKQEMQRAKEEAMRQAELKKRELRKKANDSITSEELQNLMNDLK